jgi:predicted transcriptional regulator YdeE
MTIAGLREHCTRTSLDDIPTLWRHLVALGRVPGRIGPVDYAVVFLLADGCDYVAGCEVAGSGDLPKEITRVEIHLEDMGSSLMKGT